MSREKQYVRDFLPLLAVLNSKKVKSHVKRSIMNCDQLTDVLCKCIKYLIEGKLGRLSPQQVRLLKKKKQMLKMLGCSRVSHARKKKIIQQGGIFPLLPLLIPGLIAATKAAALGTAGALGAVAVKKAIG